MTAILHPVRQRLLAATMVGHRVEALVVITLCAAVAACGSGRAETRAARNQRDVADGSVAIATNAREVCWAWRDSPEIQCVAESSQRAVRGAAFPIVSLVMNEYELCALGRTGHVRCWRIDGGMIAENGREVAADAVDVVLVVGDVCVLRREGLVSCEGLAREHFERQFERPVVAVVSGPCALDEGGIVRCAGSNELGVVGPDCHERVCPWTRAPLPSRADAIVSTGNGVCARSEDRRSLYFWGGVPPGHFCSDEHLGEEEPLEPGIRTHVFASPIRTLHAGGFGVCALLENRELHCASFRGLRSFDGLSRNPERVAVDVHAAAVDVATVCVVDGAGALRCGGVPPPYGGLVTRVGFPGEIFARVSAADSPLGSATTPRTE